MTIKMRSIRRLVMVNVVIVVIMLTVLLTITGSMLYYRSLMDAHRAESFALKRRTGGCGFQQADMAAGE